MSAVRKHKMQPADWTFMFVAVVMSLALTRVGGKLFAADSAPSRKFAVIATGYHEQDSEAFKEIRQKDSLNTYRTLVKNGYKVTWLFKNQTGDSQGVSGALLKTVFEWSEHIGDTSNSLHSGDQVLILVRAHGEPRRPNHILHRVEFGDGPKMDMESLKPYFDKLRQGGIKVALIDSSCYSGNSLGLAATGACVISSQNRFNEGRIETLEVLPGSYLAAYNFDHDFQKALEKQNNANLEQIFLQSRKYLHAAYGTAGDSDGVLDFFRKLHYENDLPEISSAEHSVLRPIWDRVFSLDQTGKWARDLSDLESASQIDLRVVREFERLAKDAYDTEQDAYGKFLELIQKRVAWINELSSLQKGDLSTQASASAERKRFLMRQLTSSESEYRRTLGWLFFNERFIYDNLYQYLGSRGLSNNACREFRL
jgi:hypothetical protein